MTATAPAVEKNQSTAKRISQSATVLAIRFATGLVRAALARRHLGGVDLLARQPVAPLAARVVGDRGGKVGLREVGPEHRGEEELGVRGLQQEEIAHAGLARGPDHE